MDAIGTLGIMMYPGSSASFTRVLMLLCSGALGLFVLIAVVAAVVNQNKKKK